MTKRQAKIEVLNALASIADSRSNQPREYEFKVGNEYRNISHELQKRAISLQATEKRSQAKKDKK